MKKSVIVILVTFMSLSFVSAQNIQFLYDFSNDRKFVTTTLEMFKPDKWGSTFFFVDMDFSDENGGIGLAYFEIARELKFWEGPISFHTEFNGGLVGAININNAWLNGATYSWNAEDFSQGFSFSAMHKYIDGIEERHNFQLTTVWYKHFFDKALTFSGFADWWREKKGSTDFIFLTEPQLWYNLNTVWEDVNLSIGGELEISKNFVYGSPDWEFKPALGCKWTF